MKIIGPELGNLSTRFFAYIQLKKLDIIRTGEIAPVLGISASQETDLLRRLSKSGWVVRLKRGVYLVPSRLPANGKFNPGIALILQKLMEVMNGKYQICGPTAYNFFRLDDQIPNITYLYNNCISGKRTIGSLTFQFIKVSDRRLGAVNIINSFGGKLVYSSKARTLMDTVYDWSRFNSLPRGYNWIKEEIKKDSEFASELLDVTMKYGNVATGRRIGYLLDTLIQNLTLLHKLKNKLGTSKSIIPLVPGKPSKGKVNRKWGIIIND